MYEHSQKSNTNQYVVVWRCSHVASLKSMFQVCRATLLEMTLFSPIGEHMGAHNHSFAPETVTVKCKEKEWFRRGIAEANLDC